MTMRRGTGWLVLLFMVAFCVLFFRPASAAPATNTAGLGVSPALASIDVLPSQDSATFQNTVSNNSGSALTVDATTTDFTMTNGSGALIFNNSLSLDHGLSAHLQIDQPHFTLAPHETKQITITLVDATQLKAGGHYGAVLYKLLSTAGATAIGNKVSVNQTVASLLFVNTAGTGTYSLSLDPIEHPLALFHLPNGYNLTFRNTGNVQATPRGYVHVSGPLGQYSQGVVNSGSALVLPATSRLLVTPVSRTAWAWLPGKYTVRVYYRYEGQTTYSVKTQAFWYINIGGIACIIFIFTWLWRARYRNKARIIRIWSKIPQKSKK